jgi:hypothetical protein
VRRKSLEREKRVIGHARVAILSVALLGACASPTRNDRLSELVDRHTVTAGGAPAIEATKCIEYRIDITEPTFQVSGIYVADRSGRMRIDVYAGGKRVYTEAFDGKSAWQTKTGRPVPVPPRVPLPCGTARRSRASCSACMRWRATATAWN